MMYSLKFAVIFSTITTMILAVLLPIVLLWLRFYFGRKKSRRNSDKRTIAFFHPYCNAGGGGERVLWRAVEAFQERYPEYELFVFTGDVDASPADILKRVNTIFNIPVKESVKFVYLNKRRWVEANMYPYFTLLGQSLGSIVLGLEALNQLQPGWLFHFFLFFRGSKMGKKLGYVFANVGFTLNYAENTTNWIIPVE